jgi:UDP-2,3-diacylglucosamine pyrophosphatase LpxH
MKGEKKWLEIEDKFRQEINKITQRKKISELQFPSETILFGVVSDTHCGSIYERVDILNYAYQVAEKREDMIYLGAEEQDVILKNNRKKIIMRLFHPSSGTAYAISYKIQKAIESYSGGQKPNILLCGHFHKSEYLPCQRNVLAIQAGCLQSQTPYMRTRSIAAHIGFWIVSGSLGKDINRFKAEFFAFYEK